MRRKRRRWRWRRHERVCGDNAASREPRWNRVISAARPNTCPIIFRVSALAGADKGLPCFWYHHHRPRRTTSPPLPPVLLSIACPPTSLFSASHGAKRTERLSLRGFDEKEKTEGWYVRWLRLTRCYFYRFNDSDECGARNPFEEKERERERDSRRG